MTYFGLTGIGLGVLAAVLAIGWAYDVSHYIQDLRTVWHDTGSDECDPKADGPRGRGDSEALRLRRQMA